MLYVQTRSGISEMVIAYCVLNDHSLEYFKSRSADSKSSGEELLFLGQRCQVRELPESEDLVCKTLLIKAHHRIELSFVGQRLAVACSSKGEKEAWMEAINLAIFANQTAGHRAKRQAISNLSSSTKEEKGRNSPRFSVSRSSEVNDMGSTRVVYVTTSKGKNTLNKFC